MPLSISTHQLTGYILFLSFLFRMCWVIYVTSLKQHFLTSSYYKTNSANNMYFLKVLSHKLNPNFHILKV